jgi:hypothetical protein
MCVPAIPLSTALAMKHASGCKERRYGDFGALFACAFASKMTVFASKISCSYVR